MLNTCLIRYDASTKDEWVNLCEGWQWERVEPTASVSSKGFAKPTSVGGSKPAGKVPSATPSPDHAMLGAHIEVSHISPSLSLLMFFAAQVWWPRERNWHQGTVRGCYPTGAYHIEYGQQSSFHTRSHSSVVSW